MRKELNCVFWTSICVKPSVAMPACANYFWNMPWHPTPLHQPKSMYWFCWPVIHSAVFMFFSALGLSKQLYPETTENWRFQPEGSFKALILEIWSVTCSTGNEQQCWLAALQHTSTEEFQINREDVPFHLWRLGLQHETGSVWLSWTSGTTSDGFGVRIFFGEYHILAVPIWRLCLNLW